MNQQANRVALGIVLAVVLLGVAWRAMPGRTASDAGTQSGTSGDVAMGARTPIDVASLGPQVGERVPDFSLLDQNGQARTLDDILGPRGALLLFHRSADW